MEKIFALPMWVSVFSSEEGEMWTMSQVPSGSLLTHCQGRPGLVEVIKINLFCQQGRSHGIGKQINPMMH